MLCWGVEIFMPETLRNKDIIQKYKDRVNIMYTETDGSAVVGSFVHHSINIPLNQSSKEQK